MHPALTEFLQTNSVLDRRCHPELSARIDYAVRKGELTRILPNLYTTVARTQDWRTLVQAASMWDPAAVVCGEAAAALTFWSNLVPSTVEVATSRRMSRFPSESMRAVTSAYPARLVLRQRTIPPALVSTMSTVRITAPALTAVDMISTHGTDVIDTALRSRQVTLEGLHRALALTARRGGNPHRRRALLDSRTEPWSALERLAHRHLRNADITAWRANVPIVCRGHLYYQDVALTRLPLTLEFDGYEHHCDSIAFEHDRLRGNALLLAGRQVLHFTWAMVHDEPDYLVNTVRQAMQQLAALQRPGRALSA